MHICLLVFCWFFYCCFGEGKKNRVTCKCHGVISYCAHDISFCLLFVFISGFSCEIRNGFGPMLRAPQQGLFWIPYILSANWKCMTTNGNDGIQSADSDYPKEYQFVDCDWHMTHTHARTDVFTGLVISPLIKQYRTNTIGAWANDAISI